ncbi:MAG: DNA/RNA nuclease SfsA [Candidatus Thiodiazotropha sp. (ex Notomyrtea botanica)]|nr:DNA/RNA nuclease SfsA [Candidatus Thiodiazotropha sp. (ex Notomyrtea botanica)]
MRLPPLTEGRIVKRYKRFLADVMLPDGQMVTAHCPNTGSMQGCWSPDAPVQLSHSDNPKRKLAWTLERVDMGNGWIGVHTGRSNPVIEEAIRQEQISLLKGYASVRREVMFDPPGFERARFDLFLSGGTVPDAWVEVKNVTLWLDDALAFPDAVTVRGRKHLELLAEACRQGYRGVMVYALNRPEGSCFRPAEEIDPVYAKTLRQVVKQGVEVIALRIAHQQDGIVVSGEVPVVL